MKSNEDGTFEFLTRSYVVAKFITVSIVAIAGIAVSIVALDVSISKTWTDVRVPLYIVAIVTVPLLIIYGIFAIIFLMLFKDSLSNTSFYKNKAGSLEKSVSYFQDLAYNDPITGIKNSRGLNRELAREGVSFQRCLMLLDLIDFGSVNNKYNHWKGDEYLRQFSEMVSCKSRHDRGTGL